MATNPRVANGARYRANRARVLATYNTCALCDQPVDKTLGRLHPDAPVVDHIVPVIRGGPNTWANSALMHRRCNAWKGTMTLEEARSRMHPNETTVRTSQTW